LKFEFEKRINNSFNQFSFHNVHVSSSNLYLQDTLATFENYTETAELADGRSRAIGGILDNAHLDRHNRLFGHIGLQTCVRSLTILSRPKLGIPKYKKKRQAWNDSMTSFH